MNDRDAVYEYHDRTKHHFHRFARSMGRLDWASQPYPFRLFEGSPEFTLYPAPAAGPPTHLVSRIGLDSLCAGILPPPASLTGSSVGDLLRHALGLSAWKHYHDSRWSLRVNPSSGNLHPTEAYVICPPLPGLAETAAVYHYAPDRHALDLRCTLTSLAGQTACPPGGVILVFTSIHWREAWKYGERAFRYCQHDLGHAVAAAALAAAALGWRARMLRSWSHQDMAAVTGADRDQDFIDAEREDPACALAIAADPGWAAAITAADIVTAARGGRWHGRANQLSASHVEWTAIDDVARATEDVPRAPAVLGEADLTDPSALPGKSDVFGLDVARIDVALDARAVFLQRRSALAFDGRSAISLDAFTKMLARVVPTGPPWDAVWWTPRIHLAIFVHRVDGLTPGLYLLARDQRAVGPLQTACKADFVWTRASEQLPLFRLAVGDCRALAQRLSCDQSIAGDGFFSLGMIADFDASLAEYGPSFYRHLFWEAGMVGQMLYLGAELAGGRATGIGCYYDDPVHDVLGLDGHTFQSLYHFSAGVPVEDTRLTARPGYDWES